MSQITVRGVPEAVERAIRKRAAEENKSINRTVNELLQKALGIEPSQSKRRDLSRFSGARSPEEAHAFDQAIEPFKVIDDELWR